MWFFLGKKTFLLPRGWSIHTISVLATMLIVGPKEIDANSRNRMVSKLRFECEYTHTHTHTHIYIYKEKKILV